MHSAPQMEKKKINFMLQDISLVCTSADREPCCSSPAVHHHGPRVWRIARFHPSQEGEERRGVLRHAVVRPSRELELPDLPLLAGAVL